jgi:hypothetical protein
VTTILRLYVDPNGNLLRRRGFSDKYAGSGSGLIFKRGVSYQIHVLFVDNDFTTAVNQPTGTKVSVMLKPKGKFDATTPLASAVSTANPTAGNPYVMGLNLNTVALNAYMAVDANDANDLESVEVEFEVSWTSDNWITKGATTDLIRATVNRDVRAGTEASPALDPSPNDTWVAHGHPQSLTLEQQQQARDNIGVTSGSSASAATPEQFTLMDSSVVMVDLEALFPNVDFDRVGWDVTWSAVVVQPYTVDGVNPVIEQNVNHYPLLGIYLADHNGWSLSYDLENFPILLDVDPKQYAAEARTQFHLRIFPLGAAAQHKSRQGFLRAVPMDNAIGEGLVDSYERANEGNYFPGTAAAGYEANRNPASSIYLSLGEVYQDSVSKIKQIVFSEALTSMAGAWENYVVIQIRDLVIRPLQ